MILKSSCAFKIPGQESGYRVLIVSRLTYNDGITPNPKLIKISEKTRWIPELAPQPKTVGAWYRKEIDWAEFRRQYTEYLRSNKGGEALSILLKLLQQYQTVTVLCVEETHEHCHRSLLLEHIHLTHPHIQILLG